MKWKFCKKCVRMTQHKNEECTICFKPVAKEIINAYFLKITQDSSDSLKSEFKLFLQDWYSEYVEYESPSVYNRGDEETLVSDAYEEFIYAKQDAQWREDMGIGYLTMDDI